MLAYFNIYILILVFFILSCRDTNNLESEAQNYTYAVPSQIDDGWQVASADDVGISIENLDNMVKDLDEQTNMLIHSIIIVKDSKLIFEQYFKGYKFNLDYIQSPEDLVEFGIDTLHFLASVSKSVTSLLMGIAIDNGAEIDINEKLASYYPEYISIFIGDKANITINHLLTMSSGLEWDESTYGYEDSRNDVAQLFIQPDPIKFILEKPLQYLTGTRFNYNSGLTIILGDIIKKKSNKELKTFAETSLFLPLGIHEYHWDQINNELLFASGGLYLTTRSLAKIGQLLLNGGIWNGKQIVSKDWIELSTNRYIIPNLNSFSDGYGFQWWKYTFTTFSDSYECYFAAGWGEQFLFIFPDLNMVIVFTGGYYFDYANKAPHLIIRDYILTAF